MFALRTVNTGVLQDQHKGQCLDRDGERELTGRVAIGAGQWRALAARPHLAGDINTVRGRYGNRSRAGTLQIPLAVVCGTNTPARTGYWMALEICVCVCVFTHMDVL